MNASTKAQRLADEFENGVVVAHTNQWKEEAAFELRRLDALNAEWERKAATWLASPEAAQRLDGYRELAQRVNALETLNAELVEALSLIQPIECDSLHHEKKYRHSYAESCPVKEWIDGVIAKAKEQT